MTQTRRAHEDGQKPRRRELVWHGVCDLGLNLGLREAPKNHEDPIRPSTALADPLLPAPPCQ
jgi:hypothetical protein